MARRPSYQNYYQSFMTQNMNPLYKRYLEYLMEDLPDVSNIGGYFDVPTTAEREGIESLDTEIKTPMAPMNQTRGGDGDQRGIGKFQNLDPTSEKMVLINGVPTKVYRNITSGLLQTFDGKNVIFVPVSFDFPISFKGFFASPSLNSIKYFFPSRLISNSNFSDNAFTTETPTPCNPPETL